MELELNLCQLSKNNIKPPNAPGLWAARGQGIFGDIADGIDPGQVNDPSMVSSVPDIWARPRTFLAALTALNKKNAPHPLAEQCEKEWRGLMSLLALREFRNYPVNIIHVPLHDKAIGHPFSEALKRLEPEAIQLETGQIYSWLDIFIITFDGIPIGALCPDTIVYTGADYNSHLKKTGLNLKDENGYLCPPGKDNKTELEQVGEWLQQFEIEIRGFRGQVSPNDSSAKNTYATILTLIERWMKEIRDNLPTQKMPIIDNRQVAVAPDYSPRIGPLARYRVYQSLLKPLKGTEDSKTSSVILNTKRNFSGYTNVIVISEELLTDPHVCIYGNYELQHLGGTAKICIDNYFSGESGHEIMGEKQDDFLWIRPEKYFLTDTLLKGKNGAILADSEKDYNAEKTKYILPFKKEILDFFSWKDIKDTLEPVYKEDGEDVEFSFSLPMKNGDNERVKKLYKKRDGSITEIEVPVIEIFPNYLEQHWRRYYIFQSGAENISVEPVVFGKDKDSPRPVTEAREYEDKELKQKIKITEISGDNSFPEGLEIVASTNNKQERRGLILIDRKEKKENRSGKWKIGIDFGTSNTNVFSINCESQDNITEHWKINLSKYFRNITISSEDVRSGLLQNYFVPDALIKLPSPTLLRIYDAGKKDKKLILDYLIYFPSTYKLPTNVYSDIKWEQIERKIKYFIESILFLLLLEVMEQNMAEVEFAYSYPKAFSPEEKNILHNDWIGAFEKLLKDNPVLEMRKDSNDASKIVIGLIDNNGNITKWANYEAEGIAAGNYFASDKQSDKNGKRIPIAQMANLKFPFKKETFIL